MASFEKLDDMPKLMEMLGNMPKLTEKQVKNLTGCETVCTYGDLELQKTRILFIQHYRIRDPKSVRKNKTIAWGSRSAIQSLFADLVYGGIKSADDPRLAQVMMIFE